MIKRNKKIIMILSTLLTVVLGLSISYAYFYYGQEGSEIVLESGSISINFEAGTNYINIHDTYPKSDMMGKIDPFYYDFNITGSKGENDDMYYEIQINEDELNTLNSKYIKVYLTDQNDVQITKPISLRDLPISEHNGNRVITTNYIYKENQTRNYRLRVWVDESYTENVVNTFNFQVEVYAYNDLKTKASEVVLANIPETQLTDPDSEGVRYISGNKEDITNNYVWYSGKLWRIFAIYPNGNLKIVTDTNITIIVWGADTTYYSKNEETGVETKSWMYEWLNEDFLDTLYDPNNEIIVRDYEWNATESENYASPLPKTTMVEAPVGLLNAYEYYKTYQKATGYETGYLNVFYLWWLINPYSSSYVRYVDNYGALDDFSPSEGHGARPSINFSSNITLTGSGTKEEPYRIDGDIEVPEKGTKLNERVSGEYVNFNGEKYRIVSIENGITKITKADFIRNADGTFTYKKLSSNITYGNGTSSDYWDYYLNNDWYNSLATTPINYKGMIVEGTYYLGWYPDSASYKQTICDETITGNLLKPINGENACTRISDTSKLYRGKVGLGRVGEMFTSQIGEGYDDSTNIWTITPYSSSYVQLITPWRINSHSPTNRHGARPSINLSSNIVITDGDGTINRPFEINFG